MCGQICNVRGCKARKCCCPGSFGLTTQVGSAESGGHAKHPIRCVQSAQFLGYEGPLIKSNMTSLSLVLRDRRHKVYKDYLLKDATGLGDFAQLVYH